MNSKTHTTISQSKKTVCSLQFENMKKEVRVIADDKRNGETSIHDELTVCRWEEAYIEIIV